MMGGNKTATDVTTLIQSYVKICDQRIRHLMGLPYTIRKEYHVFHFNEMFRMLGPQEDEFEFFDYYDPLDRVEKVFAIYSGKKRLKYPFPKNCDDLTEDVTIVSSESSIDGMEWDVDDVPHNPSLTTIIIEQDPTDFMCGVASLKVTVTNPTGGMVIFPKTHNLNKAQYPWDYISMWMKVDDPEALFRITIYDNRGLTSTSAWFHVGATDFNMKYLNLNPAAADTWEITALKFMMFPNYTAVNWVFTPVQYFTIEVDRDCTFKIDNLSFNDGLFFTAPKGYICWSRSEISPIDEEIEVTYSFDPFKQEVPDDISIGSAKMAGVMLLEYLIGLRQRATAFTQGSMDLTNTPDKETLEFTKARLEREVQDFIAGIGFKGYSGISAEG
jgi:hypothetical protein